MKKLVVVLSLLPLLLTTGCWSRLELNELSIASGLGIDKTEAGEYKITVQVMEPKTVSMTQRGGGGATAPATTYEMTSPTVMEALRKLTKISPRKIYLPHLRVVVLGEKLAKEGVAESLEFLIRNNEVRNDFYMMVAKGSEASNLLKVQTSIERVPAQKLYSSISKAEKYWAPTSGIYLDELVDNLIKRGKSPVLPGIVIVGNQQKGEDAANVEAIDSPTRLIIDNLAIFKKDKLIGWFNEDESKGYNYITDNVKSSAGAVACPDGGTLVLDISSFESKMKGSVQDGVPYIDLYTNSELNIGEVLCKWDISKSETLEEVEEAGKAKLQEIIMASISKAKKLKTDVFGFGEEIHRSNPKEWKKMEQNWHDKIFPELEVRMHMKYKIRRTGTVTKTYLKDVNK